ncbi:MAG: glycosyltransferase family 2 protein [Streptomycetaceae bacterium]|nr:MAG: glycosyltransferase family 2 protein [Streptomycetaceae bacterium]
MADRAKNHDGHHVTAILVVHDGATWLPEVVASLASQTRSIDFTFAIDTGSVDSSVKLLKNSRVPVITMERDCGFGEAIAAGIKTIPAPMGDDEWLWFIHDDCAPTPDALSFLLSGVTERPQVAIAGPKLRGWYDRTHLLESGISIASNGARWTGLEPREYDQGQHDGIREVLSVSTAGMLVRRKVFEELGGFDNNLSLFRDDVDLGWRVHVAGHSVIAVTDAIAWHAEASASERREIDVKSPFLKHHLLLDRRNAAYVLLTNSSWWVLPLLSIQLLGGALFRAFGYLLAKLPGYATDEILAVGALLIRPRMIVEARKVRKSHRLISSRVVSQFIPPRRVQLRMSLLRATQSFRQFILPPESGSSSVLDPTNEDEDLLTPVATLRWRSIFRRPQVSTFFFLFVLTTIWSRNRFGSLAGGALPATPSGAMNLLGSYADSWHEVAMGSASASPPWIAILAMVSAIFLGKANLLVTLFFWTAPLLIMWSMYSSLKEYSSNSFLRVGASLSYALSPVALASISAGRLGSMVTLIIGPQIVRHLLKIRKVEKVSWQFIFALSLLIGVLAAFSMQAFIAVVLVYVIGGVCDVIDNRKNVNPRLMRNRLTRRFVLIATPLFLSFPWSFQVLSHPGQLLLEPGLSIAGGGSALAWLANPGGIGSIPWWAMSPAPIILLVALFSSTKARLFAEFGVLFVLVAAFAGALAFPSHGDSVGEPLWVGSFLTFASISAVLAGVVILDGLRDKLASTGFHFRHILAGLVVALTVMYAATAVTWTLTTGANSPVRANQESVLPPFLALNPGVKTLVIRAAEGANSQTLNFYISRGSDARLGDPDTAPTSPLAIDVAVRQIVDGSGLASSKVLSAYGIKYVFMKNPIDKQFVHAIDGLGGFVRNSATDAGIVWRVDGVSEKLVFTNTVGKSIGILADPKGTRTFSPGTGTLSLAENFDASWEIIQDGQKLPKKQNEYGLPEFVVTKVGEFSLTHDGTARRGMLALQSLILMGVLVMATPARRRRSEISVEELT